MLKKALSILIIGILVAAFPKNSEAKTLCKDFQASEHFKVKNSPDTKKLLAAQKELGLILKNLDRMCSRAHELSENINKKTTTTDSIEHHIKKYLDNMISVRTELEDLLKDLGHLDFENPGFFRNLHLIKPAVFDAFYSSLESSLSSYLQSSYSLPGLFLFFEAAGTEEVKIKSETKARLFHSLASASMSHPNLRIYTAHLLINVTKSVASKREFTYFVSKLSTNQSENTSLNDKMLVGISELSKITPDEISTDDFQKLSQLILDLLSRSLDMDRSFTDYEISPRAVLKIKLIISTLNQLLTNLRKEPLKNTTMALDAQSYLDHIYSSLDPSNRSLFFKPNNCRFLIAKSFM